MEAFHFILKDLFNKALPIYGEKIAIQFEGKKISYEELNRQANCLAHALINHGVGLEDAVAMIMSNCIEFAIVDIGIMKAGAAKVAPNDMLGEKEYLYILQESQPKVVIVGEKFYEMIERLRNQVPSIQTVVGLTEAVPEGFISWDDFLDGMPHSDPQVQVRPHHRALIAFTGGTTGTPKGVIHSQYTQTMSMIAHIIEMEFHDQDKNLLMTPLSHAAGRRLLSGLLKGATHIITERFDPVKALEIIEKERITTIGMVPTMIYRLLDAMESNDFDVSSIRMISYGASPIAEERLKQGIKKFGKVFHQNYGQTEVPNLISRLTKFEHSLDADKVHRLRSCGRPCFMSEVKIVDEDGNEVPRGELGEIVVKSPYMMAGYLNRPDLTAQTIKNGWLHTGDIGKMDEDGYIYLMDRKKDMIISGGMNIYSSEVEHVIHKHPGVDQVAVIGIPHDDWGEQVMALIIPNAEQPPTEEDIFQYCDRYLAKYKRPKKIKFVDEFPLTPYGKVDKNELRKPYWKDEKRAIH